MWSLSERLGIEIGPTVPRTFAVLLNMQEGAQAGLGWTYPENVPLKSVDT